MMGLFVSVSSFAQSHSDRISVGAGALYQRGLDATISWEHETRYHNAWEYFINGYIKWDECASCGHVCPESFWNNYRTWGVGAAYKPCVARGRNNYGNLRIGARKTRSEERHGWGLFVQAKCDLTLPKREDLFRTGIVIGFKIPTLKK